MKHYVSNKAVCPYYLHESKQVIDCVGFQEGTVTHIAFANAAESLKYKKNKCRADYRSCVIFKMLLETRNEDYSN